MISSATNPGTLYESKRDYLRFQKPHLHLQRVFGNDWFALKAEAFARFFGTPLFLVIQTVIAEADAEHREAIHQASEERHRFAAEQTTRLVTLLQQNTELTAAVKDLSERIEALTADVHKEVVHVDKTDSFAKGLSHGGNVA